MKTTLLVMAAGMGSRFGGLKQMEPVGPNGAGILDYSCYDAKRAGFEKVVFVIRPDIAHDFKARIGNRIAQTMEVAYAFQTLDRLPPGFSVPDGRTKPWGTAHAVLCAKEHIHTPFAVINSDDYYGIEAYGLLHQHLTKEHNPCMVAFALKNTLTENGTVSRGICETKDGYLTKVTEHTALDKNSPFAPDTLVSMNMWGLYPAIFDRLEAGFFQFLKDGGDPLKKEYFLPDVMDQMIQTGDAKISVLKTPDRWYGMTYRADLEQVKQALAKLRKDGFYHNL